MKCVGDLAAFALWNKGKTSPAKNVQSYCVILLHPYLTTPCTPMFVQMTTVFVTKFQLACQMDGR